MSLNSHLLHEAIFLLTGIERAEVKKMDGVAFQIQKNIDTGHSASSSGRDSRWLSNYQYRGLVRGCSYRSAHLCVFRYLINEANERFGKLTSPLWPGAFGPIL